MEHKYFTYILKSINFPKTYVGHTNNIERRLVEHNNGLSFFTKRFLPWKILHFEVCKNLKESIIREKYLKSCAGRKWIKKQFFP